LTRFLGLKGRIRNHRALALAGRLHQDPPRLPALVGAAKVAAIPRTLKLERLSQNIDVFGFELSDEEMNLISAIRSASGYLTDCGFAPK
jgi:2,5-diketo-D-gluconate reductase B